MAFSCGRGYFSCSLLTEMNEGLELNNIGFTNFIHLKLDKLVTYHLILFYKFIGHELSLKNYWYLIYMKFGFVYTIFSAGKQISS